MRRRCSAFSRSFSRATNPPAPAWVWRFAEKLSVVMRGGLDTRKAQAIGGRILERIGVGTRIAAVSLLNDHQAYIPEPIAEQHRRTDDDDDAGDHGLNPISYPTSFRRWGPPARFA